jgi:hypothetical protein
MRRVQACVGRTGGVTAPRRGYVSTPRTERVTPAAWQVRKAGVERLSPMTAKPSVLARIASRAARTCSARSRPTSITGTVGTRRQAPPSS